MKFDAVMFDCDGVIVDSEFLASQAHGDELRSYGLPADDRDLTRRYMGIASVAMVPMLEQQFTTTLPADYLVKVRARMAELCESGLPVIDGIRELVHSLDVPACVVSNSPLTWIRRALTSAGLLDAFDGRLFSAEMVKRGKPAPDLLLHAAATLKTDPVRCVMIEDSRTGVLAAKAAGVTAYGFVGGRHCCAESEGDLLGAGAARCFPTMAALKAALAE